MDRWQHQEEAFVHGHNHNAAMFDMDMGTGKTRVALDLIISKPDVKKILVVCTKNIIRDNVWRKEVSKHKLSDKIMVDALGEKTTVAYKAEQLFNSEWIHLYKWEKLIITLNYDIVWRKPLSDAIRAFGFDMVILDESHRAKAAGSKVSKFLALLGKQTKYKYCLTGTPMGHSPLDVYGQFRFLDSTIFGTNHQRFLDQYAIMGGAERRFVVGLKNQNELMEKFNSITYSCKMNDVKDRLKLPDKLPPTVRYCQLPAKDYKTSKKLIKEFFAEIQDGYIALDNALQKGLRLQQITSGFCMAQDDPLAPKAIIELNDVKERLLEDILSDISPEAPVVVFCVFRHDLDSCARVCTRMRRKYNELSGRTNDLKMWKHNDFGGGVLAVQIQAGAEGIDLTQANLGIYYSLPNSLALYDQSQARLYRPGQKHPVSFIHLLAEDSYDQIMYDSLIRRGNLIKDIQNGKVDYGWLK